MIRGLTGRLPRRMPLGMLLLALSVVVCVSALPEAYPSPEELPDYDYLPRARQLAASGDYEGCIQLCADIISEDLPNAEQAIRLVAVCEERRSSPLRCGRLAVRGFVTGDSSTFESAAGAVVSDLTLYGDIRDLSVQGWRYVSGRETDPFIVTFSAVGIVTEFADWADWLPAVLKAFKRAGALTGNFCRVLIGSARTLGSSGVARKAARELFGDLATLCRRGNLHRAKAVLGSVDTARELKVLARAVESSPGRLHLACRGVGTKRVVAVLEEMPSPRTLRIAARKGPAGVEALRKLRSLPGRRRLKWAARLGKVFRSRHAAELLNRGFARFPKARYLCVAVSGVLALLGVWLMLSGFRRRSGVSAPSSAASDAPTNS